MIHFKRKISNNPICGIYLIINKINNKVYVGKSIDIEKRWQQHKYGNSRIVVSTAIKKYGRLNFDFIILEDINPNGLTKSKVEEELCKLEQKWMDDKKSYIRKFGYNICKTSKVNLTPKKSKDTGVKISKIKIEMNHCGKPVIQYSMNGEFIKEWKSAAEIERSTGIFAEHISAVCLKKHKTSGGFIWRHKDDELSYADIINANDTKRWRKKVVQMTIDGQILRTFESLQSACDSIGAYSTANITHVCKGRQKSYKGFIWKYLD